MNDRDSRGRLRKRASLYVVSCDDHRTEPMSLDKAKLAKTQFETFGACKLEHRIEAVTGPADTRSTDNDTKESKR